MASCLHYPANEQKIIKPYIFLKLQNPFNINNLNYLGSRKLGFCVLKLIYLPSSSKTNPLSIHECHQALLLSLGNVAMPPIVNSVFFSLSFKKNCCHMIALHDISNLPSVLLALYAWIIFPVLVCSTAGERENYSRTISCPQSAFHWLELAYNSVKTSEACVVI